jgi:hypothetical protein
VKYHSQLLSNLELPAHVVGSAESKAAGLVGTHRQIVDSFFQALLHLQKQGRSFNVVLRTFGRDIKEVVTEMNAFFEGKHPMYPDVRMDGSDGGIDYRVSFDKRQAHGTFYRDAKTIAVIIGTLVQPSDKTPRSAVDASAFDYYEQRVVSEQLTVHRADLTQSSQQASQYQGLLSMMSRLMQQHRTLALRDDWAWWSGNDYHSSCGKMMLVDKSARRCVSCL